MIVAAPNLETPTGDEGKIEYGLQVWSPIGAAGVQRERQQDKRRIEFAPKRIGCAGQSSLRGGAAGGWL